MAGKKAATMAEPKVESKDLMMVESKDLLLDEMTVEYLAKRWVVMKAPMKSETEKAEQSVALMAEQWALWVFEMEYTCIDQYLLLGYRG